MRRRNRTKYNKRKQRGGEYSKMAKAVIENNRVQLLDSIKNDDIKLE